MNISAKIHIAGRRGLFSSALLRNLEGKGYKNFLIRTHAELDLTDQTMIEAFFKAAQPDYVFLAAAKVGASWPTMNTPPNSSATTSPSRPTSSMPRTKPGANACERLTA